MKGKLTLLTLLCLCSIAYAETYCESCKVCLENAYYINGMPYCEKCYAETLAKQKGGIIGKPLGPTGLEGLRYTPQTGFPSGGEQGYMPQGQIDTTQHSPVISEPGTPVLCMLGLMALMLWGFK